MRSECAVVDADRAARVIFGVVNFRSVPPSDPVNVAVVVEKVVPGKVVGAIQKLVVPQFEAAGGTRRFIGARAGVIGVGRRFFGDRREGPGAVVRKVSRGQIDLSSRVAAARKYD